MYLKKCKENFTGEDKNLFERISFRTKSLIKRSKQNLDIVDIKDFYININNFTPLYIIKNPLYNYQSISGIISYSLFGKVNNNWKKGLLEPLLLNCNKIKTFLPNWLIRIYISSNIDDSIKKQLFLSGAELYVMKENNNNFWQGLLWRFLVAEENKTFIISDADSIINLKTINKINYWQKSNKKFFRIATLHNFFIPINAGNWGGKSINNKPVIPNIKTKMAKYNTNWFGSDEAFLSKEIWPSFIKEGYYEGSPLLSKSKIIIIIILFFILIILVITIIILLKYN